MDQRNGDTDTLTKPENDSATQRYEAARAAAHRAMTSVTLIPDKPLPPEAIEPERLSYRGFKFGAAFFGWLIMGSMVVLLTAIITGATAGTTYVLDYTRADAEGQAGTTAITAAAVFVLMLSLAFYTGGVRRRPASALRRRPTGVRRLDDHVPAARVRRRDRRLPEQPVRPDGPDRPPRHPAEQRQPC